MSLDDKKRFIELAARADARCRYCFTEFLDLAGQNELQSVKRQLAVPYSLFGGVEGCERRVARFGSEDICGYEEPFPIVCLKISPRSAKFAETLTHRDFLGSLMALGIERELLGDIVVHDSAYLFCLERIAPFIIDSLSEVKHTYVNVTQVEAPPEGELFKTQSISVQIQSERLDALVAHIFKLSRGDAQELFGRDLIFVNGAACPNTSYAPKSGDIVSVRGYGRFKYIGVSSLSKKGKSNVTAELYI